MATEKQENAHYLVEAVDQISAHVEIAFRCVCGYRFSARDEDDFEVRMASHEEEAIRRNRIIPTPEEMDRL